MNARAALQELYNRGVEVRLINDGVKLRGVELLSADELDYLRKMKSDIIAELKSTVSRVTKKSCCICGDTHAPFGVMYSWRDPDKAQWYCPDHYKKCPKSSEDGQHRHDIKNSGTILRRW